MTTPTPTTRPRHDAAKGLATLALLKANFDAGNDHIDMFLPFVLDTIAALPANDFAVEDVKAVLESRHRLQIPAATLRTILARARNRGAVRREGGRFFREASFSGSPDLTSIREGIEREQREVAAALIEFAQGNGIPIASEDDALALLLDFFALHHVSLVLFGDIASGTEQLIGSRASPLTSREGRLVARFVTQQSIKGSNLLNTLRRMLEGFVLQNALLLRDISTITRRFSDLTVFLDTGCLLEVLGLKGESAGLATREALDLLRNTGAELAVFDKTVIEVKRLFHVYEERLATAEGVASLYPTDVTRYVLTHHLAPSDMREMISLLEPNLRGLGLRIRGLPLHEVRYTSDEKMLTEMIKRPLESDLDFRVVHDVDCIAAIMTLRAGYTTYTYDDAKAVFATTSGVLVSNVREWYRTSGERGMLPVIHQLALSNIAWLKKPAAASALKLHELVALCSAALLPSRKVWSMFIKHLQDLRESKRLSSDEVVAIVVSNLTDSLLSRFDEDVDADAETIQEVVERVQESYQRQAHQAIRQAEERHAENLAAEAAARRIAEEQAAVKEEQLRKFLLGIRARSLRWARGISWGIFVLTALILVIGSFVPLFKFLETQSPFAWVVGYSVWGLALLLGIVRAIWGGYLSQWRRDLEFWFDKLIRRWLLGDGVRE